MRLFLFHLCKKKISSDRRTQREKSMKSIRFDGRRCCCFDSISQTIEKKVERIKAQQSATSPDKIAQLEPMIISLWDIAPARERKKTKRKQRKKESHEMEKKKEGKRNKVKWK